MSRRMASWARGSPDPKGRPPRTRAKKSPSTSRQRGSGTRASAPLLPADDGGQGLDDLDRADPWIGERRPGGVAEAEPADDDVEVGAVELGEAQVGEGDLGRGEDVGHEVLVAELDLVDVDAEDRVEAATDADLAHRRGLAVELLEQPAHRSILTSREGSDGSGGSRRSPSVSGC
jgi:hypothetical protein